MNIFNKIVSYIIPYVPKILTYQFAKKYVAGTTKLSAMDTVKRLNNDGYLVTLDILGEHTKDEKSASLITNQYIDLYNDIHLKSLLCNISLKPTHIGSEISTDIYNENLHKIHALLLQ